MKRIIGLIIAFMLFSGMYAKQYIYSIKATKNLRIPTNTEKMQDDLEKVLFDLIIRGNKIVQVIPTVADGFTIGYTIIYENKNN